MNSKKKNFFIGLIYLLFVLIALSSISCQYDYHSPLPGTIEIHLKTISNNIGFTDFTNFVLKVNIIRGLRADGAEQLIYEDKKAIKSDVMIINVLNPHARDGDMVIGQAYAPPGNYAGIGLIVIPGSEVIIGTKLEETQPVPVQVVEPYNQAWVITKSYSIRESHTTKLTLVLDLDKSLIKGAYNYYFLPSYSMTVDQ